MWGKKTHIKASLQAQNASNISIKTYLLMNKKEALKQQILQLSREYYNEVHRDSKIFEPGKSFVNYGGRYFDA